MHVPLFIDAQIAHINYLAITCKRRNGNFKRFTHFSFQTFAEGGADRVPLAVSSSIEVTPIFCPVLQSAGDQLRSLYGKFCSRCQEAVSMYREMIKDDRKFVVLQCTMNPLQEERNSWVHFVLWLNASPIIRYSSMRSSRLPGSRRRNLLHILITSNKQRNRIFYLATARFGGIRLVFEGVAYLNYTRGSIGDDPLMGFSSFKNRTKNSISSHKTTK